MFDSIHVFAHNVSNVSIVFILSIVGDFNIWLHTLISLMTLICRLMTSDAVALMLQVGKFDRSYIIHKRKINVLGLYLELQTSRRTDSLSAINMDNPRNVCT